MAFKSRKHTARADIKQVNKLKSRSTHSLKHPTSAKHQRLRIKPKNRTAISRTNRPDRSRSTVVSRNYNPTRLAITDLNIPLENRRLVLCDGENIAFNDITREYSAKRIFEAYEWFLSNGHKVLVVLPDYLLNKLSEPIHSIELHIVTGISDDEHSPSINVPFELALLQMANNTEAAIVSERHFARSYYDYEDVVLNRVIGFSFFKDYIFIPVDPYGRVGPWLRQILHK